MAAQINESSYIALLGCSEVFQSMNPPKIKQCIHCLESVLHFQPPPAVQARTHLQLGRLTYFHTQNADVSRMHLEKAILISQSMGAGFEEVHVEAASILADVYKERQQTQLAKPVLRQALEVTAGKSGLQFWQFRLIFQLSEVHSCDKENKTAGDVLEMGESIAENSGSHYMRCLFSLSRALICLATKDVDLAVRILSSNESFLEVWQGPSYQKETLRVFCLLLKVWNLLVSSQAKSVKPYLKQLQQSIQLLTATHFDESQTHEAERFQWLPKEHLCVLVYLVTVIHSMQSGYMEKVLKYSEKALQQIERLKVSVCESGNLLSVCELTLLEHIITCRIVQGHAPQAVTELSKAYQLMQQDGRLMNTQQPVLNTLLGLYAMSMNLMKQAVAQFDTALKVSRSPELSKFIALNLAIIYVRAGPSKQRELQSLLHQLRPDKMPTSSHSLQAAYYYVCGLQSFFQSNFQEAKNYLRETLKLSNAEDLNRLTACALILLGHTFLTIGSAQEALGMVLPAAQLANKMPDGYIQLWAASLLKDLYQILGDPHSSSENFHKHRSITKTLLENHMQATHMAEHQLIDWFHGPSSSQPVLDQQQQLQMGAQGGVTSVFSSIPGPSSRM